LEELEEFVKENYPDQQSKLGLIKEIYKKLVESIQIGKGGYYYEDLAKSVGLINSSDEFDISKRNELKYMLAIISHFEVKNKRPMLSAIVVRKDSKRPGKGFFEWAEELGIFDDKNEEIFWSEQIKALQECWKAKISHS